MTVKLVQSDDVPVVLRGASAVWTFRTSPDRASVNWSGETGRWYELTVYQLADGTYALYECRYTLWQGERDVKAARRFASLDELAGYLRDAWPAAVADLCDTVGYAVEW